MTDETKLNNTSHGSSSEASEDASNFSFLAFLQEQNDDKTQTEEAILWRQSRQQGGRFLNNLPIHPFFKKHAERLFELFSQSTQENFTDEFHNWMMETLPIFNDLINEQGNVKEEYLALDPKLTTQDASDLLNAFNLMIGEAIAQHQETQDSIKHVALSMNTGAHDEAEYQILPLKQFFTVACMNNVKLARVESQPTTQDSASTKITYTFSKKEDRINFSTDNEILYAAARSEMEVAINMAKTIKPTPSHTVIADSILSTANTLKDNGYDTRALTEILITSNDTIFQLNAPQPRSDVLLAGSNKLTDLANTLTQDQDKYQSDISRQKKLHLAAALMTMAGIAIMFVSAGLAAVTMGLAAPISVLGIHIGVSMVGFGLACTAGALGITTATAGMFAFRKTDSNIRELQEFMPGVNPEAQKLKVCLKNLGNTATAKANSLR